MRKVGLLFIVLLVFAACPAIYSTGVIQVRTTFPFTNYKNQEVLLPSVVLLPSEGGENLSVVVIEPGYFDSAVGQIPLGNDLVLALNCIVIISDPDDYLNILPYGPTPADDMIISQHLDQLTVDGQQLIDELRTRGIDLSGYDTWEIISWFRDVVFEGYLDNSDGTLQVCRSLFYDRLAGFEAIINAIQTNVDYPGHEMVDTNRIAVCGHSAGGYAALGVAGAASEINLNLTGIKAVVAEAPCFGLFDEDETKQIKAPVLLMLGQHDQAAINNPSLARIDLCPAGSEKSIFQGFSHLTFSFLGRGVEAALGNNPNLEKAWAEQISQTAVTFLQKYL